MSNMILSNVVDKTKLREVQTKTLNEIASYLKTSFGPFGSNTIIKRDPNAETEYTKDGHDILSMIKYNGPIESTIVDDLVAITRHVVKTVGDGTTSAVEMSNFIFQGIIELEKSGKYSAYDIIFTFKKIIDDISEKIKANGKECTLDDIYDIAYTSTNGNEKLAQNIYTLYKDYGFDIYIDLQVALTSEEDIIKIYDGMTLNDGYTDPCYVNSNNNICELRNPNIYVFEDPVDTPEMILLLDKIIYDNIMLAYQPTGSGTNKEIISPIPTVIIAPMISKDMSSCIDKLTKFIMQFSPVQRPPIVIIKAYTHQDEMSDIAMMCGAPLIKKYINDDIHKKDIENGLAPSIDNITKFCGTCEMISVTEDSSKFIRPAKMFDENGEHTEIFNNLLSWCENELKRLKNENKTSVEIYNLKRRINSLKANLIEYFVGGITAADRNNNRALLEDAIKNCRSAIIDGVGSGANIEGFRVIYRILSDRDSRTDIENDVMDIIHNAYFDIINLLYEGNLNDIESKYDENNPTGVVLLGNLIKYGAYNLRTHKFDGKVKTSILSDVVILDAISKIITRMATAEQFIVPSPMNNLYMAVEK